MVPQTPLVACVDDDVSVCDTMRGFLTAFGFAAEVFLSAEEFVQSGRLAEISCLITDVRLKGMSGLQLQNHLAASGSDIPVIVITAVTDDRVREQALRAGAVCFLIKPFSKEDLLTCLRSALDRRDDDRTRP